MEKIENYFKYMVAVRRHLHMYPELSMQEFNTTKFIREELDKLNIPYYKVSDIATIAYLDSGVYGKTLAIRADIDALPIKEDTNYEFSSKNENVMHACGHDIHTSILLGLLKFIKEEKVSFKGRILGIFQPAEEVGLGASIMLKFLKDTKIDEIISSHIGTETEFGSVNVREGKVMCGIKSFKVSIKGRGGHASRPDETNDVIHAMVSFIDMATRIKEREISPLNQAVLTFATVHGGSKRNIIPSLMEIEGNLRYFTLEDKEKLIKIIERVKEAVELAHNVSIEINMTSGSSPLINDNEVTKKCRKKVIEVFGKDSLIEGELIMASDDFSKYLEKYKGCYIFVGAKNKNIENFPVHNSKFNPNEDIMKPLLKYYIEYIKEYLN